MNRTKPRYFNCDYCGKISSTKVSAYERAKRHFCGNVCYALYRKEVLPKEEQPRFGSGLSKDEQSKRRKARTKLNHYLRDNHISRPACEICNNPKSEAHHDDYDKPLEVKWLCFKHHRAYHKIGQKVYENPELLNQA